MVDIPTLKDRLISELWLPTIRKYGTILPARLRKSGELKLLTLTSERNFHEITEIEQAGFTTRKNITAWTYSLPKKLRLETEILPARIVGTTRYEDSIPSPGFSIKNDFPFQIVNLDFSSQDPNLEGGRVEKEIRALEHTIKMQKDTGEESFVILYSTVLDSACLNRQNIVQVSDGIVLMGWSGLTLAEFSASISIQEEKMRCIEALMSKLCSKYGYSSSRTLPLVMPLDEAGTCLDSVSAIIQSSGG